LQFDSKNFFFEKFVFEKKKNVFLNQN